MDCTVHKLPCVVWPLIIHPLTLFPKFLCLWLLSLLSRLDCNLLLFRDYICFSSCTPSSMSGFWSQNNTYWRETCVNEIKYIPELHTHCVGRALCSRSLQKDVRDLELKSFGCPQKSKNVKTSLINGKREVLSHHSGALHLSTEESRQELVLSIMTAAQVICNNLPGQESHLLNLC